ncbi:geranylgeranyl diphosphate synthase type II [Balneicella halophila]|uniref:Geranylgeranyl diphosphate synthase type II n=1 Tax=Balneicella halophila TaxID=1537566 RepID=A0A7L4USE4_BALHA|nr:polyprenyl synthetase family protein [Balneicella halophila]PVX52341.1 geranylgeranyl diphosphate synthase type II [Balneicella halophila]
MQTIKDLQELVNKKLSERAYEEEPIALFEPMTYALSVGGKRLRPVMVMLATQMYGGDISYAIKPALGLEIFHNFTLLHDDVMDNADIRRNQPTVHKKWNENVAILSGDAMSIKAYQYIVSCKEEHTQDVLKVFNDTALEVCKGQQLDMEFEEREDVAMEEYLQMIYFKTAVLFACSLKMGGILSEAPKDQQDELYELGVNLGMAFQLQDDYLDVYGDVNTFGKNIGGDILEKKKTYLLIKALEKANITEKADLLKLLNDAEIKPEHKIEQVTEFYNKLDVGKDTQHTIVKYIEKCKKNLENLDVPTEHKSELKGLILKLENRSV